MDGTLVDLTLMLGGERLTPVPGNPGVTLEPVRTHAKDNRSSQKLVLGVHLATHVDAPYRFDPDGVTVERMPLERYAGEGVCLDLRAVAKERTPMRVADLEAAGLGGMDVRGKIVVLYTGWAERIFGEPRYYSDGPYLGLDGAEHLVALGVNAIAVDFPIDHHQDVPDIHADDFFPVHRFVLTRGVPLIENVVNLDRLVGRRFELWALPLKILGADGSATRAVARVYE